MPAVREQVVCRTPTPGKTAKKITAHKFNLVREKILRVISQSGESVAFADLPGLVASELTSAQEEELGSVAWYVTTVKLELEMRGELERLPSVTPQRLRLARGVRQAKRIKT